MSQNRPSSLYIHIPFCKHICSFCDFSKIIYNQERVDKYIDLLINEIKEYKIKSLKTIYIGGGTPSSLDMANLCKLLSFLQPFLKEKYEFTIECNIEDLNDSLLKTLKEYGINRLSLGVQSFNEKFIKYSKRMHTKEMAINNINLAFKYINNISIDMIYGFPNQSIDDIKEELSIIGRLPLKHISYYSLQIEEGTYIFTKGDQYLDSDLQYEMAKLITKTLSRFGLKRYEISNYAKANYQSKHNKVYWNNNHYYAAGVAASSYIKNTRITNTHNTMKYLQGNNEKEIIILSKSDIEFEQIMLNLRLTRGLNLKTFAKRYDINKYSVIIKKLIKDKMLIINGDYLRTTFKGSMLLNAILEEFILDK